jgi:hypothetical protein
MLPIKATCPTDFSKGEADPENLYALFIDKYTLDHGTEAARPEFIEGWLSV